MREPKDYRVLNAYLRCAQVVEDADAFQRDVEEFGDDGFPFATLGRTPFQQLWIQWVNIQDLCLHLVDAPDVVAETVELMNAECRKVFEAVHAAARKVDIPYVNFGDNITAPVIGEANFRKYCVPLYDRMADMMSDVGVPVAVHMDGDLKPLWTAIGESGVRCLDSFSPPPDNDTSAGKAAAMWPQMRLLLNFPSSVHLAQPAAIYDRAMTILSEAGHTGRLWIQISENLPPERWRVSFPEIVRAIQDFGKP